MPTNSVSYVFYTVGKGALILLVRIIVVDLILSARQKAWDCCLILWETCIVTVLSYEVVT